MQAIANPEPTANQIGRPGPREGTYITCDSAVGMHVIVDVPEVVVAVNAIGVTLNEQLAVPPAGAAMLAVKATLPVNPPFPVTVTVVTPCPPEGTLIEVGVVLTLNAPFPLLPPVIVKAAGAVVALELKLGSPL